MESRLNWIVIVLFVLIPPTTHADRTDVLLSSTVQVSGVDLRLLPDGGCTVVAYGSVSKSDGGVVNGSSGDPLEVSGANQTTCLNILNVKGPQIFKAAQGL